MPIPITTKADFLAHLHALGIEAGNRLCVHTRLMSFGRIAGGAAMVRDALLDIVGKKGTIAVPTFTFNLTSEDIYDPAQTPAHLCGSLSDCLRLHALAKRTYCPVHSFAAVGPAKEALMAADPSHPMGAGSAFEAMLNEDFKLVLLGCTYDEGATYVHHVEAMASVKYRSWITFPRKVRFSHGRVEEITIHYYGRTSDPPTKNDLSTVERAVERAGEGLFVPLMQNRRRSHTIDLAILDNRVKTMIAEDPYALVQIDSKCL